MADIPVQAPFQPLGKFAVIKSEHIGHNNKALSTVLDEYTDELNNKANETDVYTKEQTDDLVVVGNESAIKENTKIFAKENDDVIEIPTMEDIVGRDEMISLLEGKVDAEPGKGLISDTEKAQIATNTTNISKKANSADVYTKSQVDTALSSKANSADVYTKTQMDTSLSAKANASSVYTKTQIDTSLASKMDASKISVLTTAAYEALPEATKKNGTIYMQYDEAMALVAGDDE